MAGNLQRISKGGKSRNGSKTSRQNDIDYESPLASLHSRRKEEDFSCKDCLIKGLVHLYNFTIASCNYAFCNCLRVRHRRGYADVEMEHNSPTNLDNIQGDEADEVESMKTKLRFHFMNPFQKWKYQNRRRFPWKLITQLLALIVVTTQLWVNAQQKFQLNSFVSENVDTFEQLFVFNSQFADPTVDYYHTSARSLIITKDDFWKQLNYTAFMYYNIKDLAVGPFGYAWRENKSDTDSIPPLVLNVEHYKQGSFKPEVKTYSFMGHKLHAAFNITNPNETEIRDQLNGSVVTDSFDSILNLWFKFYLSSVYLDAQSSPLCCQFAITLNMKNRVHTGSMPVSISTKTDIRGCSDNSTSYDPATGIYDPKWMTVLDSAVLLLMIVSTIQCVRSIVKAGRFTKKVRSFFIKHYQYKLRLSEYLPLYNWWFVGVVVSNVLVSIGTILFLVTSYIEVHHLEFDDIVSIVYGMGVFLQWCGLLRFLSYFDKYNMLLITLRLALPSVIRFMVCGFIFYVAFLLLGWLVLGPYHPKFKDPSVTSECLFSLINGDDMFNTYILMDDLSMPAFIFSKIYLYVFISLFIYVVLSVFISLISDTYETLHEEWSVRSRGLLQDFANDQPTIRRRGADNQYDILTSSMFSTQENSPLIPNGGPLVPHVTSNRNTPTLQLPVSNPNSPRTSQKRTLHLYPDLDGIQRPQIIVKQQE